MQPNWLLQRQKLTPTKIGLHYNDQQWTFDALVDEARNIASKLRTINLRQGDRVAILANSTPDLIQFIYGCMYAQIEIVFLNTRLTEAEMKYQVQDALVKAVLVDEVHQEYLSDTNRYTFNEINKLSAIKTVFQEEWEEQQTISIMYTSGTTGNPKGVRQTLKNHEASAVGSALNIGTSEKDVWLCAVPIFHISGFSMLMKSLLYGVSIKLYEKFNLNKIVDDLIDGSVTHMSVVAMTLGKIITELERRNKTVHPNFRLMLAGGGPIPTDYLERAFARNIHVAQTYGMTETASQTATLSSDEALRKLGSAGKPLFFNQIKIDGTNEPYIEGEILIKGPHVTPGYIGQNEHLAALQNGWLHSGDIGYLDEEGFLFVVDRRSDLIISGGENIYPAQIENVLLSHPAVEEAGVCGVEDEQWGQVPAAFIVKREEISEQELIDFCKKSIASYKVPKYIYFVSTLPRTGNNKLMRRNLKKLR